MTQTSGRHARSEAPKCKKFMCPHRTIATVGLTGMAASLALTTVGTYTDGRRIPDLTRPYIQPQSPTGQVPELTGKPTDQLLQISTQGEEQVTGLSEPRARRISYALFAGAAVEVAAGVGIQLSEEPTLPPSLVPQPTTTVTVPVTQPPTTVAPAPETTPLLPSARKLRTPTIIPTSQPEVPAENKEKKRKKGRVTPTTVPTRVPKTPAHAPTSPIVPTATTTPPPAPMIPPTVEPTLSPETVNEDE